MASTAPSAARAEYLPVRTPPARGDCNNHKQSVNEGLYIRSIYGLYTYRPICQTHNWRRIACVGYVAHDPEAVVVIDRHVFILNKLSINLIKMHFIIQNPMNQGEFEDKMQQNRIKIG